METNGIVMTHHIDKAIYQGYMWKSDEQAPAVYDNQEVEFDLTDGENPFVVEGQLYDEAKDLSIGIKFIDGKYIVSTYDGKEHKFVGSDEAVAFEEGNLEQYAPNRKMGLSDKVLYFKRLWKTEKDVVNYGWETLCPSALIFKGFGPRIKGGNND